MKTSLVKTIACAFGLLLGTGLSAQCNAAFTFTVGSGGQVNFSNTSTGTGFMTNYYWDFGDNGVSNAQSPNHIYTFNGGYRITLTVMDSTLSCSSTFSDSVYITNAQNNFSCSAGFTYGFGSGGTVNFTNTSSTSLTNYGYAWSFGDGSAQSTQASPSHTYPYNGTYYATVQITDSLGNGLCSYSQYISVTNGVNCSLNAGFTYTDVGGGTINFNNTTTGPISGANYTWNFCNSASSNLANPSHTFQFNSYCWVTLHVTDSTGLCSSNYTDSVLITSAQNPPTCTVSLTYTLGASGLVSFSPSYSGNLNSAQLSMNFGNGSNTYQVTNPTNYTYPYNGTYYVYFYATDSLYPQYGCNYQTQVTITNTANNPNTCADSVWFNLIKDTTQTGVWYAYLATNSLSNLLNATWNWGDGSSSTGLNPSHTYANAGWYTVCVSAFFACGDSAMFCTADSLYRTSGQMISMQVINTANSIHTNTQSMTALKAYPNPFNENLTLNFTSYENSTVTCILFDLMGNQVMKENLSVKAGDNELKLKTESISRGIYFINLSSGKQSSTLKVVK